MRSRIWRLWLIPIVLLALLVPLLSISAAPSSQAPENAAAAVPDGITLAPRSSELMAAHKWTQAEMAAAIPMPMPEASVKDVDSQMMPDAGPAGVPGTVAAGLPATAKALDMMTTMSDVSVSSVGLMGYAYPGPFTRYLVSNISNVTRFPFSTVGKVYFTQRDGVAPFTPRNYVASAESIGNYALFTAGHVVHNGSNRGDGWSYNVVFVPALNGAQRPFGTWTGMAVATLTPWYQTSQLGRDWGVIGLNLLNGLKISQRVGWLGFAWNFNRQQDWVEMGYPQAAPFSGTQMWAVNSSFAYQDNTRAPATMGVGNDMTGGCSGGPWIKNFGTGNYVNGVNSYRYTNPAHPLEMYSPFSDGNVKNLWDVAQAWHP